MKLSSQIKTNGARRGSIGASAILAILMLTGCSSIIDLPGGGDPVPLYELRPLQIRDDGGAATAGWILFIEEPSAPSSMRSERVAIHAAGRKIEYAAGARWGDRAPQLIGRYMVESLENAGVGIVVGQDHIELRGDYRLKMDIRDFSAYADGNGGIQEVKIRISALVVRTASVSIVSRQQFTTSSIVNGNSIEDVIEAFNGAMDEVASQMITWLQELPAP